MMVIIMKNEKVRDEIISELENLLDKTRDYGEYVAYKKAITIVKSVMDRE